MAVHHGKISNDASKLAKKTTPKKQKSDAGKNLEKHKEKYHKKS